MSVLEEYEVIMARYRAGGFGEEPLSMHGILSMAGRPGLFEAMPLDDLRELEAGSSGFMRMMLSGLVRGKEAAP